jgi:hypothetical protein
MSRQATAFGRSIRWAVLLASIGLVAACNATATTTPATSAPVATLPPQPTLQPLPTVEPTQTPAPTSTPETIGNASYDQISFNYDLSLASTVTATTVPGQPPNSDAPWDVHPDYVEFNLVGYPSTNNYHKPHIDVYPVAEYGQINDGAQETIDSLKQLLADKPAAPENIPLLPIFNAAQVFRAQIQYVAFQNGEGVRFVTQYDQALIPINNQEVFYTFQGLTDDGQYYVAAIFPVAASMLPDTGQLPNDQWQAFSDNFQSYIQNTTQQLGALKSSDFNPDLSLLDALVQSLQVK